jgi:hypothetical protein
VADTLGRTHARTWQKALYLRSAETTLHHRASTSLETTKHSHKAHRERTPIMKWNVKLLRALFVASTVGAMVLSAIAEATWG